ncbi:MAG: LysR family transcriptional regulator [Thermomicrobiales bacterium]
MEFSDVPINLNRLRLFLAVVEHGGVRKAAEAISISQPAVSQSIQALEAELGLDLLERLGRKVRPTEAGMLLAEHGRRIFAEVQEARRALDDLKGIARGHLFLGASTTIGIYVLPDALGLFHQRYPEIALSLNVANTQDILEQLLEARLDIAFVEGPVAQPGLTSVPFLEDELVLIVAPGHALMQHAPVSREDLAATPFLMRESGSGTREVVEQALAGWEIVPNVMMELGHTEAIKNAVAAGLGVSILPRMTVARDVVDGRLAILPIAVGRILRNLLAVQRSPGFLAPATRAFLEQLQPSLPSALLQHRPGQAGIVHARERW